MKSLQIIAMITFLLYSYNIVSAAAASYFQPSTGYNDITGILDQLENTQDPLAKGICISKLDTHRSLIEQNIVELIFSLQESIDNKNVINSNQIANNIKIYMFLYGNICTKCKIKPQETGLPEYTEAILKYLDPLFSFGAYDAAQQLNQILGNINATIVLQEIYNNPRTFTTLQREEVMHQFVETLQNTDNNMQLELLCQVLEQANSPFSEYTRKSLIQVSTKRDQLNKLIVNAYQNPAGLSDLKRFFHENIKPQSILYRDIQQVIGLLEEKNLRKLLEEKPLEKTLILNLKPKSEVRSENNLYKGLANPNFETITSQYAPLQLKQQSKFNQFVSYVKTGLLQRVATYTPFIKR